MEEIGIKIWKKVLKNLNIIFLHSTKMSEKALKFGNAIVNKKEFHAFKKSIPLNLVDTDKIVIFDRFKHSDHGSK